MPKELLEVKRFNNGIISSPSETDIPDDAASFSVNIDATSEEGKLKGIPEDRDIISGINATSAEVLDDDLVYFDYGEKSIKRLSSFSSLESETESVSTSDFIYASDWDSSTDLSTEATDGIDAPSAYNSISKVNETDSSEDRQNVMKLTADGNTGESNYFRMFDTNYKWSGGDIVNLKFDYYLPSGQGITHFVISASKLDSSNLSFEVNSPIVTGTWATLNLTFTVKNSTINEYDLKVYLGEASDDPYIQLSAGEYVYIDNIAIVKNVEKANVLNSIDFPSITKTDNALYVGLGREENPLRISIDGDIEESELKPMLNSAIGTQFDTIEYHSTASNVKYYLGYINNTKRIYKIAVDTSEDTLTLVSSTIDIDDIQAVSLSNALGTIYFACSVHDTNVAPCRFFSKATGTNLANIDGSPITSGINEFEVNYGSGYWPKASMKVIGLTATDSTIWLMMNSIHGFLSPTGTTCLLASTGTSTPLTFENKGFPFQMLIPGEFGYNLSSSGFSICDEIENVRIGGAIRHIKIGWTSSTKMTPIPNSLFKNGTNEVGLLCNFESSTGSIINRYGRDVGGVYNMNQTGVSYAQDGNYLYLVSKDSTITSTGQFSQDTDGNLCCLWNISSALSTNPNAMGKLSAGNYQILLDSGISGETEFISGAEITTNPVHKFMIGAADATPALTSKYLGVTLDFNEAPASEESILDSSNDFLDDYSSKTIPLNNCNGELNSGTSLLVQDNLNTTSFHTVDTSGNIGSEDIIGYTTDSSNVRFVEKEAGSSIPIGANYKVSYIYDGYQESPLSSFTFSPTAAADDFEIHISLEKIFIPNRVTDIVVYRLDGATYRHVGDFKKDKMYKDLDATVLTDNIVYHVIDSNSLGASYEARTGCPQTMESSIIKYSMSEILNGELVVADSYIPETGETAENYIFKSKPGNFSQFNWVTDNLLLPETPTCIKAFNGRLFAFTENKIIRINANGLYIEDIHEGIGCLNKHCAITTEFGMFFVDKNGAYLHNGSNLTKLSTAIEKFNFNDSWSVSLPKFIKQSELIYSSNPNLPVKVSYEPKSGSFLVWGHDYVSGANVGRIWAYNLARQRWDWWESPLHQGLISRDNGDTLVFTSAHKVKTYQGGSTRRKWEYYSKFFTMGTDTQEKILSRVKLSGGMVQTISNPAVNTDTLRIVTGIGATYLNLSSKKDYYKLNTSTTNYTKSLCDTDNGTFSTPSIIELYEPSSLNGWFNEVSSSTTALQIAIKNHIVGTTTFTSGQVFWLEDINGEFPKFTFCDENGSNIQVQFLAQTLYVTTGTAPYMKVASGSVWDGLSVYPGLKNESGQVQTNSFLYNNEPTCTINNTAYTTKTLASKKVKKVQVQLREQTEEMDAIGIIYRRKTVK